MEARGSAAPGEEGCWFAAVGSPAAYLIAEASPRCGGEASVVCSVSSHALARVTSGGGSSQLAGVLETGQLLFQ